MIHHIRSDRMKRIELPLHGIALQLEESAGDEDGSRPTSYSAGTISSELKDTKDEGISKCSGLGWYG